jgi:aminoglycoside 6'-N-acetyltransferase I
MPQRLPDLASRFYLQILRGVMSTITIRRAQPADKTEWLRMRLTLWPKQNAEEALAEMDRFLADPLTPIFVAVRENGELGGFLEGGLRKYAEGCDSSPVAYLEGWFVDEDLRRQGIGRGLVRAMENWAREQSCTEIASDTWLDNTVSIQAHFVLGYEESERLIHFRKSLQREARESD